MLNFSTLGADFYHPIQTQPLASPHLIHQNMALTQRLGLDLSSADFLAVFSGKQRFNNTPAIASIYAGHQFGHFNPQKTTALGMNVR